MRLSLALLILLSAILLSAAAPTAPALAAANVPVCLTLENAFNNCMRQNQYRDEEEEWDGPYAHRRRRQDCNGWLVQLKAAGCW